MKILRALLFPFTLVYHLITEIRNRLYDQGLKPAASFDVPVIGVGNLTIGGTGKTPMVEHLIRLLSPQYKVATLSRGYGRRTRGIRIAGAGDSPETVGDEPFQFFDKFNDVYVAVGEERALAITYILNDKPDTEVIIMDDAFQHRRVRPSFQVLLTEYSRLFHRDFVLPSGNLRESKKGARRADAVVVTKCPREIGEEEMMKIQSGIRLYTQSPIFFSTLRYNAPAALGANLHQRDSVILVSGIAETHTLTAHVEANYRLVKHLAYRDHHRYTRNDLQVISDLARKHNAMVITTEKDAVKIKSPDFKPYIDEIPWFYLPIEIEFIRNGKDFDEMLLNVVKNA